MTALLLAIVILAAQGIPVLPNQTGTIAGSLRTTAGTPAAGVRVSALAKPEALAELNESSSLAGIAETDASGRFRLENIPPGRYYIVAGRIDLTTYYPGAVNANEGMVILVTPGVTLPGIDFVLNNASVGRAISAGSPAPSWVVSVQTRIEGGGAVPIFEGGWFPLLRLARTDSPPIDTPLSGASVTVPNTEYRASVVNLPQSYAVRSFTFGPTDLRTNVLQVVPLGTAMPRAASMPVASTISIVLERKPLPSRTGVRISGRIRGDPNRSIYISSSPGTVYPDGTFEFLGVPPGRHAIVTLDNPGRDRALAASLVVGDRDIPNVELEETPIAPLVSGEPQAPAPAGNRSPNTRIPLAAIRGRVVDSMTGRPMDAGRVIVNSDYANSFSLDDNGRFEVPRLLPGKYVLDVVAFGIGTLTRTVALDDTDTQLDLTISSDR
jgi:hypothetical protein